MIATYEIVCSQYTHPEHRTGMHANGPAGIFIRRVGGPWYRVIGTHQVHRAHDLVESLGVDRFLATHCHPIEDHAP